jgi:phosphoadenosine phosphosulfate reductase
MSKMYAYEDSSVHDVESGYASGASSQESLPEVYFTKPHLKYINSQLQKLEPEGM